MENSRRAASLNPAPVAAVPAGGRDPADLVGEPEGWLRGWVFFSLLQ